MKDKTALADTLKYIAISLAVALLCGLFFWLACIFEARGGNEIEIAAAEYPFVVIDAGHGGEDGGASDASGNKEKDVNLAVASMMADYLRLCGVPVKMTRADDRLLYDVFGDLPDYTGCKKIYDLRNRLRIAEENVNGIFVSIHMNTYPSASVSGLQTWYSPNNSYSQTLAQTIQTHARTYLDPSNERKFKNGAKLSYLLERLNIPSVIVECGFLSCPDEAALLQTDEYRRKIAVSTGAAVIYFLDGYTNNG